MPTATPTATSTPTPELVPTPTLTSTPTATPQAPSPQLKVHFIDVGQGDSILVDLGEVEVLIDGGPRGSAAADYLTNCKCVDGSLEVMVATHPDADHIGGLIAIIQSFQVNEIRWNGQSATTTTYLEFMALAQAEPGAALIQVRRGDTIRADGLVFNVLNPPAILLGGTNDNSIVLRLEQGEIAFLFTGDAEHEAEDSMLATGLEVQAQILKVGHHGSRTSSSQPFLAAVGPEVAVYMAGEGNRYGHPHEETILALNQMVDSIYGTDKNGTIVVTTDGQIYGIQPEK